jgi:transcriptional regulator NrdR family protein
MIDACAKLPVSLDSLSAAASRVRDEVKRRVEPSTATIAELAVAELEKLHDVARFRYELEHRCIDTTEGVMLLLAEFMRRRLEHATS